MKTIGIYPGQFQPPHRGHYEAYKKLRKTTGTDTFVVTTDYDPTIEAALHYGDKEQILTRHGIPASHIRQVKSLLNPKEILDNYDSETTVVIYGLNNTTADKLINKSSYWKGIGFAGSQLKPYSQHGYILIIDDNLRSKNKKGETKVYTSKNVREALGSERFTDEQKKHWFELFFNWFDLGLFELLKNKYKHAHQSAEGSKDIDDLPIKEQLANEIRKVLSELNYDNSTSDNSSTALPTVDNMASNNADAAKQLQQQKQDLVKQKQQSERDLKSLTTDKDWKEKSILSLRKDQIPGKRKEIDAINQQLTNPSPTTSTTTSTSTSAY